jgi:rhodanese-related sulfurtransferase
MFSAIKKMLGLGGPEVNYTALIKNGAIILDVRTKGEFSSGHIKRSINIPLDQLGKSLDQLKNKENTIITCCASGMRSASAKGILKANGYQNVHNGGGWINLRNKL